MVKFLYILTFFILFVSCGNDQTQPKEHNKNIKSVKVITVDNDTVEFVGGYIHYNNIVKTWELDNLTKI